ncbi:MAG: DNA polymerase/3'-5' exonuclease PolX [Actinobacteria bacterium]|nr:DNA polymerase/3'-5' exonuclease PolX [Actinomycetota bacterium]
MKNRELASIFEQMADLLEILGQDPFRINSYRKVARIVGDLTEDIEGLWKQGRVGELPGVGKNTAGRIDEYCKTGRITAHQELLKQVPAGLPELLDISGLGPKTIAKVWRQLEVTSLDELQQVIDDGRLAELPGLGQKKAKQIARGIVFRQKTAGRTPLGIALPIAEDLAEQLSRIAGVSRVEIAGSARRRCETIGDVDLLVQAGQGKKVIEAFTKFDGISEVLAAGTTKASVLLKEGFQVDVRVVSKKSFGAALAYFTGSKAHNVAVRGIAVDKKLKLNEYGLFKGERRIAGADESGIYSKLGLDFVVPEIREDRGEIQAAQNGTLPNLLEISDIRGDLHMHTTASDGTTTIEELAQAAKDMGYEYIAVTEHSGSSAIAHGLNAERLLEQIEKVRQADIRIKGIKILASAEVDILADGSLDYPPKVLDKLDLVTASIHSGLAGSAQKVTFRLLKAMESPYVDIIGHPTGRLLGQREAMDLDMAQIIATAAERQIALELNSHWVRLDLKDVHLRMAKEHGVKIALCTDAHSVEDLQNIRYGIWTARRGWLQASDVLNAKTAEELVEWVNARREARK